MSAGGRTASLVTIRTPTGSYEPSGAFSFAHGRLRTPPDGAMVMIGLETTRSDGAPLSLLLERRSRKTYW